MFKVDGTISISKYKFSNFSGTERFKLRNIISDSLQEKILS